MDEQVRGEIQIMGRQKKLKKTLVEQILDKARIPYESLAISALPKDAIPYPIYKTLALIGDKTGPLIGIVPLEEHLSEKSLARISGNKKVSMIPQKELENTTGYVHGANNPVGIRQKHAFPIYIDQTALTDGTIIVSAGEIGRSICIDSQILADFVQAEFADFILKEKKRG